jgi:hypothetical protein
LDFYVNRRKLKLLFVRVSPMQVLFVRGEREREREGERETPTLLGPLELTRCNDLGFPLTR